MNSVIRLVAAAIVALAAAAPFITQAADPAPPAGRAAFPARERFHAPYFLFDERYRGYPPIGESIPALPQGAVALDFQGLKFFFQGGVWYQASDSGYVIVDPPTGIALQALPPGATTLSVGGVPYFHAKGIYYVETPDGYQVTQPPIDASVTPPQS
jgi:hypothetical protein